MRSARSPVGWLEATAARPFRVRNARPHLPIPTKTPNIYAGQYELLGDRLTTYDEAGDVVFEYRVSY